MSDLRGTLTRELRCRPQIFREGTIRLMLQLLLLHVTVATVNSRLCGTRIGADEIFLISDASSLGLTPVEPAGPCGPWLPVEPTEPVAPVEPVVPVEPVKPVAPF